MVEAPIHRVEVFEDRVSIVRTVPITEGRHELRIGPLTPLVTERYLSFLPGPGVVVEDSRVERAQVHRDAADPALAQQLETQRDALDERYQAAVAVARRAHETVQRASHAARAARAWTPRALLEEEEVATWVEALQQLDEDVIDARVALTNATEIQDRLERELADLTRRRDAAREGTSVLQSTVVLTALATGDAPTLSLRYTVPCGVWRPVHRARLADHEVHWELGAMVWNATGEDWNDVELSCSTARPGDHATPPTLSDDRLTTRRRDKEVVVESRDEVVKAAREGSARQASEVPGVDDGGETRTFTPAGKVSIASTGRPTHIALDNWSSAAVTHWRAHPERSPLAVLVSRQQNGGTRPLLAGPVWLVRDSGAVGRGQIGLVPAGEPFDLSWGSHDGLRITRRADQTQDRAMLTGRQSHQHEVTLHVVHMGDAPVQLEIRERIPVSEVKEVKVGTPRAEPGLSDEPDDDGFCAWRLDLEPGDKRTLALSYTVEAPSTVRFT